MIESVKVGDLLGWYEEAEEPEFIVLVTEDAVQGKEFSGVIVEIFDKECPWELGTTHSDWYLPNYIMQPGEWVLMDVVYAVRCL